MLRVNKILFPCNLEENLADVFAHVLSIAKQYHSTVFLLHVVGGLYKQYIPPYDAGFYQGDYIREFLDDAERFLNRLCREHNQSGINIQKRIVHGIPAAEIIRMVESENIDLVIMATHGYKGLKRVILGSVVEKVLKEASVPVLVINPYKLKKSPFNGDSRHEQAA